MSLRSILKVLIARSLSFANETAAPDPTDDFQFVESANEYAPTGGWQMLAPYGNWPNRQGMQRFEKRDAENICNDFKSFANIGVRALGIPFYVGHPDHPLFEEKYKDGKAYGRIKALEAREDGLFGNVKWSRGGKEMIEDGAYHGHSVNWRMAKEGSVFRPVSLKSVGWTNEPNIPVPAITSANEKDKDNMNKVALQLGLPADATEAQIQAKLTTMANEIATAQALIVTLNATKAEYEGKKIEFANAQQSITTLTTEKTTLAGQVSTLTGQVTTLTTERDTARTNFVNERKAHTKALLDAAQKDGRITAADRTTYETEFANETSFAGALTKLGTAKATLPIQGTSRVRRDRGTVAAESSRIAQVQNFVNEEITRSGCSYDDAFAKVQSAKPELFAQMHQPSAEVAGDE